MRSPTLLALCLMAGLQTAQAASVQVTVLARDGQPLPDAVVVLEPAAGQAMPAAAPLNHTITQEKMQFQPVVSVVPVGSRVKFANMDRWDHHVRGGPAGLVATGTYGFEFRLAGREAGKTPPSNELAMDKAGPIQLGCHLHGSMRGFVYVSSSPWTAKTSDTGVATLAEVPEGAVRVRIWHPDQLLDPAAVTLQVQAVTAVSVPTQVQPRKARRVQTPPSDTY